MNEGDLSEARNNTQSFFKSRISLGPLLLRRFPPTCASPFPYVAHLSFNPHITPFLSLALTPPFSLPSLAPLLQHFPQISSPQQGTPHPLLLPTSFPCISPVLSIRGPSTNPITSALKAPLASPPHLPCCFSSNNQPPPQATCTPPPRLWLLLPLRRAPISGHGVQDAPSVRGQWSGCFSSVLPLSVSPAMTADHTVFHSLLNSLPKGYIYIYMSNILFTNTV